MKILLSDKTLVVIVSLLTIIFTGILGLSTLSNLAVRLEKIIPESLNLPSFNMDKGIVDVITVQIPEIYGDFLFSLLKLFILVVLISIILLKLQGGSWHPR